MSGGVRNDELVRELKEVALEHVRELSLRLDSMSNQLPLSRQTYLTASWGTRHDYAITYFEVFNKTTPQCLLCLRYSRPFCRKAG